MPGGMGDTAFAYYHAVVERDGARSLAFAENAVRALPNDAASLSSLGTALHFVGRVPEALAAYQQARALDPMAPGLIANELEVLAYLRRKQDFLRTVADNPALVSRALLPARLANLRFTVSGELPAAPESMAGLSRVDFLWRGRRFAEALEFIERALTASQLPEASRQAHLERKCDVLRRLQRPDEAAAAARELLPLTQKLHARPARDPSTNDPALFRALARAGRADEAIALARRYVDAKSAAHHPADRWHRETRLAELYAETGRPRECIALLTTLLRAPGGLTVPMLRVAPDWDNVRDDPGFKSLLADPKNSMPL